MPLKISKHSSNKWTRGSGLFEKYLARKRTRIAEKLIHPKHRKGRVLDLGCGLFPYFLTLTQFKEKFGLDSVINREDFDGGSIYLKKLDIEKRKIPFPNEYFDVVIMLAVFEHIKPESLERVLKEVHRILKKEGIFIITTPSPWSVPILWILSRISIISKVEIDDHKSAWGSKKIKKLFKNVGFSESKIKSGYFEAFLNIWISAKK